MTERAAICESIEGFQSRQWNATLNIIFASDSPLRDAEIECLLEGRQVTWLY